MPTYTDIKPRDLKPALLELDGISRASVEARAQEAAALGEVCGLDPRRWRFAVPSDRQKPY